MVSSWACILHRSFYCFELYCGVIMHVLTVLSYGMLKFRVYDPLTGRRPSGSRFYLYIGSHMFYFCVIKHAHICMHAHTPTIYTYMHLLHSPQVLLLWHLLMERFCVCQYAVYSSHRCLTACKFRADSHYRSCFCSVIVPSPFRQIDLCSHCCVQSPSGIARDRRPALISIKYAASFIF